MDFIEIRGFPADSVEFPADFMWIQTRKSAESADFTETCKMR